MTGNKDYTGIFEGKNILLVDDDEMTIQYVEMCLRKTGVNIYVALDGKQGVEMATDGRNIDMILMDIRMPVMDGVEATKQIKEHYTSKGKKSIPVIAITAQSMIGDREKYLADGLDDYISKPFEKDKLIQTIQQYLK